MARIVPDGWEALEITGSARREIETLHALTALPPEWTVLHGVHWTRIESGCSVYGDIDFIVVAPNGRALMIEQRSGFLEETPEGLHKAYGSAKKRVATQILRSIDALAARFARSVPVPLRTRADAQRSRHGDRLAIDYLLYCPDYQVRDPDRAGLARERIVDVTRAARLPDIVVDVLTPDPPAGSVDAATALRFFSDELVLVADVQTLIGRHDAWVTRLAGGLAHWAMQLAFAPFRLRIEGTAGSGKTQLALRVLEDAAAKGRSALYLCYNRPLADYIARIAPPGTIAVTYHGFGDRLLRAAGEAADFTAADVYRRFESAIADTSPSVGHQVDVLIVDEGQDFTPEWRDAALRFVKPDGMAWWLEDPLQNLYGRDPVALDGWVTMRAHTNYRTPRDIVDAIVPRLAAHASPADAEALLAIETASPISRSFASPDLEIVTWREDAGDAEASDRELADATMRAITRTLAAGFRRSDVVVLTFAGREHSRVLAHAALGPHALRRFTGSYDLFGNPDFSEGEVLAETIYRFKGQSAPCVVFTEIDFDALDARAIRKLFVGATRATVKLVLVTSERSARMLAPTDEAS